MPRETPILASFAGGLMSPYLWGRVDHKRYFISQKQQKNFISLPHGALEFRGGTRFIAERKDHTKLSLPFPFEFGEDQAYQIEIGDGYMRFFMNKAQILNPVLPYEIGSPYSEAHLPLIKFCQSYDVMYLVHPLVRPQRLTRQGHTNWSIQQHDFIDGPYLSENVTPTTLTPSAFAVGAATLTASATAGINRGQGFLPTDIGRAIGIKVAANAYGWAVITAYTSPTVVTVDIKKTLTAAAATAVWRLGLWSDTTGWPSSVTFHEERLTFSSYTPERPQRIDGTKIGVFDEMTPGTTATDAISFSIASNTVNKIRWLVSMKALLVGTRRAEFVVAPSSTKSTLAPNDIDARSHTRYGASDMLPVEVGNAVLFIDRQGRKVREFAYSFEKDQYDAPDITLFADTVTKSGLAQIVYQQEPWSLLWGRRNDGQLVASTYLPDQDVIAWHEHPLAVSAAGDVFVEGLSVIPGDGTDEVWLFTRRTINGQVRRYVEVLEDPLPIDGAQADAFYVDCGLTYEGPADANMTGLEHLEGEMVTVLADGAVHPPRQVVGGAITLEEPAEKVHVGLPYLGIAQPMAIEAGQVEGTAQGKIKLISGAVMRVVRSLGGRIGRSLDKLQGVLIDRDPNTPMDQAPPLFTGDVPLDFPGDWDRESPVFIVQDQPLPFTITALSLTVVTNG